MSDPTQQGGTEEPRIDDSRLKIEQAIAENVRKANAAEFNQFNEDTGEIVPNEPVNALETAPEAPEPEAETKAPEAPAPAAPKVHKITVYGQTIEVTEDKIIEAGKRTLQKESAADQRLAEAAQIKREAEERLRRLQEEYSRSPRAPSQQDAPQQTAPSQQDAPQVQAQQPTPTERPLTAAEVKALMYADKAEAAANTFRKEFADIASDPRLMAMAAHMEQQRLDSVAALNESPGDPFEAYRAHGEEIRKWLKQLQGPAQQAAPDPSIAEKAERKKTIQTVPTANAKAPTPAEKRPPTVQELIEQERKARQGRPVPGYQVLGRPRLQ